MVVSLSILVEFVSMILCLHYFYGEKVRFDKMAISCMGIELILMQSIYHFHWNLKLSLMIYPILIIYCGMRFGFDSKKILINNILCIIVLGVIQFLEALLISIIFKINQVGETGSLLINIGVFCFVIFVLKKCNLSKISNILQNKEKLIILSLMVSLVCLILCLTNYKGIKGFDVSYYVILIICAMLIGLTVLDIGKHKMKVREAEAELRLHKIYEESFRNLIDDIRARQHEFDNHINTIYSQHFSYGTYEELVDAQRKYCKDIVNENHFNKLLSKGNPIILGFLYGKFLEIERQGIELRYKVNIENMESAVPIYKLIEILGNFIKNAVEAVSEDDKANEMEVTLLENNKQIKIEIGNESKEIDYARIQQFFEKGYSEKGERRGFGLYNVRKICEEYDIEIKCFNSEKRDKNWLMFALTINKALS